MLNDLRSYLRLLGTQGMLARISEPISTMFEVTELHRRVLARGGPALLLESPVKGDGGSSELPLLTNLFGTIDRIALALGGGRDRLSALGEMLARLRQPAPPVTWREALRQWPLAEAMLTTRPKIVTHAPCQADIRQGGRVSLHRLPIQTCWPGEPAPLITWPIVITRPPGPVDINSHNWGVYRMQVLDRDRAIIRWLEHRGGARHFSQWRTEQKPMPVAVAIGADPATMLAAVMPVPETLSEASFSGLLRGSRTRVAGAATVPLLVPAEAEIVLEGFVAPDETAPEGPYGDHTGYYNAVENYPVMRLTAITTRKDPIYVSTHTGRAPDEPSILSEALNDIFLPMLRQQFPEVVDCWLPPEAASYRIAVLAIRKRYAGQARRLMMALWSLLPQFTYTKLIIVVDDDINARSWSDVMWAVATRADAVRDLLRVESTPIDVLDFASPAPGLGGKLGIDATEKIAGETCRDWGRTLHMDSATVKRIDELLARLPGLTDSISTVEFAV